MKIYNVIVFLLFLFMPVVLTAQERLSNTQTRNIISMLLESIEQYELNADMHDEFAVRDFKNLFLNNTATIWSDILDYKFGEKISLEDYSQQVSEKDNVSYELKGIDVGKPTMKNGTWHILVTCTKAMVYTYGPILFSSNEQFKSDYSLTFDYVYDTEQNSCKIATIDGNVDSRKPIPNEKFLVIQRNDPKTNPKEYKYDNMLKTKREMLEFNSFSQAIVNRNQLMTSDPDIVKRETINEDYGTFSYVQFSYKFRSLRLKSYYGWSIGDAYKVSSVESNIIANSKNNEIGADFGFLFPIGTKTHCGFFIGASYVKSQIDLSYEKEITYNSGNFYHDGKIEDVIYTIKEMTEGVIYSDLAIPLYFEMEHNLGNLLMVELGIGARYYMNMPKGTGVIPFHVNGFVTGGRNPGVIDKNFTSFLYPDTYLKTVPDIAATAFLGLSVNLFRHIAYLNACISYEQGLVEVHSSGNNYIFNDALKQYPIISSLNTKDFNLATRSLIGCVSFMRQALKAQVGITMKF